MKKNKKIKVLIKCKAKDLKKNLAAEAEVRKIYVELFKNKKEAENYMKEQFETEIKDIEYNTTEREIDILSAYNEGYFSENHCEIKLMEREVNY